MFEPPTVDSGVDFSQNLYVNSLPEVRCTACREKVPRRKHRVAIRASWRPAQEHLCPNCWATVCQWAVRFALDQGILPGFV